MGGARLYESGLSSFQGHLQTTREIFFADFEGQIPYRQSSNLFEEQFSMRIVPQDLQGAGEPQYHKKSVSEKVTVREEMQQRTCGHGYFNDIYP